MPWNDDDLAYFANRAEQERRRAQAAIQPCAQLAHVELAELFERRCAGAVELGERRDDAGARA